jgi:hypothetical protein
MTSSTTEKRYSIAFALSLSSGILLLLNSIISLIFFMSFQALLNGNMMGNMMGAWGIRPWFMWGLFFPLSFVSGAMVLFSAIMMNIQPRNTYTWGIIVLIFSILGFVGMGLSILGSIIGVIGGALALSKANN